MMILIKIVEKKACKKLNPGHSCLLNVMDSRVLQDTAFFFTECRLLLPRIAPVAMIGKCSTLAIVKPHAVKAGTRI